MYGCLGGPIGAPMVTDDRYLRFGHRWGRLRQENAEYEDFKLGGRVFTIGGCVHWSIGPSVHPSCVFLVGKKYAKMSPVEISDDKAGRD